MTYKIGRNDPCPCGSGKKYKQCCANSAQDVVEAERKGHAGAAERAIDWLMNKHRKAVSIALAELLFDDLSPEEKDALKAQDQETWNIIHMNAMEWLLAEGEIPVQGKHRRVSEYLLSPGGPLFTADQRRWITQLGARPLRLYDVTDLVPGQQLTLCDSLDAEAPPIIVRERSGAQASLLGLQIGVRIMEVDGHCELSGAIYAFSHFTGPVVRARMRQAMDHFDGQASDLPHLLSTILQRQWLAQFYAPMPMPAFRDAYSGEPMLLITDHYRVTDWQELTQSLSAQSDIEGDRETAWNRLIDCTDGETRSVATINIDKSPDRITVFYKTQRHADEGRLWFESIAGHAVRFVSRELSDPAGLLRNMPADQRAKRPDADLDLSPEVLAEIMEETLRRMYAKWPDEPLPALAGKTPRQAINTPAGLERVGGLIRMYEASEKRQAAQQGRRTIPFDFLWQALGISRHAGSP